MDPSKAPDSQPLIPQNQQYPTGAPGIPQAPPQQMQMPAGQYPTGQNMPFQYQQNQTQPGNYQQPPPPAPVGTPIAQYGPNTGGNGQVAPIANPSMFRGVTTSVFCQCPSCGQATHTRVEIANSPMQWILCLIMFILGLWCCCCIPFCVDSMKGGNHYCSSCNSSIGQIGS
ncbi:unnamed protein product [Moneuplotes crassus]|uniref:LITAF domain-containing protein n=1 Tax=Euplotes crassus TaxID=5936 RepID=A0AAD1XSY9_EUPCR|nr:unnamed protein product [Moneuplotes crassus]